MRAYDQLTWYFMIVEGLANAPMLHRALGCRRVQNSHHGDCIIVEHGGNIFGRELIRCVRDKEASLPHSTITDNDTSARGCHGSAKAQGSIRDG